MAAYYPPPPTHYQYYDPPPPPPPGAAAHPPAVVVPQPLHHQQYLGPQPQFVAYAPQFYAHSSHDEVRTLFIAGLPEDVKAREIYNLFREFPGYESSHLRTTASTQPFAFAVFADQQSAALALHALNGMIFDLEKGSTLYIDLAKSNPRSKRLRTDDEGTESEKRMKSSTFSKGTDSGVGSIHMPGMGNSAHNTIGFPSTQSHGSFDGRGSSDSSAKMNTTPCPCPCPTLFVANLGPTCSEQELIQVFSRCHGFLKLKLQSTYGTPVAFVDFQDSTTSTEALSHLQGTVLYSGGLSLAHQNRDIKRHSEMPSPKPVATAAGMLRSRLGSALRTRGGDEHGPSRWSTPGHQERPNGYLFNRTPPPPGQSRKWEDWELPCYITSFLTIVILGVGLNAKPDLTLETWAHQKALERLKLESAAASQESD